MDPQGNLDPSRLDEAQKEISNTHSHWEYGPRNIRYEVRIVESEWDNVKTRSIRKIPYIIHPAEEHPIIEENKCEWAEGQDANCCLKMCCNKTTIVETHPEVVIRHRSLEQCVKAKTPDEGYVMCGQCPSSVSENKGILHKHMTTNHARAARRKEKQD